MEESKKAKLILLSSGIFFSLVTIGLWIWAIVGAIILAIAQINIMVAFLVLLGMLAMAWGGFFCLGAWSAIRVFEKYGSSLKYN